MASRKVSLIGVPMDFGAAQAGANAGPQALRRTRLLEDLRRLGLGAADLGDVPVPARPARAGRRDARFLGEILEVCRELCERVHGAHAAGSFPVVLGGDHSLGVGSVAGTARFLAEQGKAAGVIWVDAHADMNTPSTSPSGNVHGMPVAHLLGLGDRRMAGVLSRWGRVRPRNVCLVGLRDVDEGERRNLRRSQARVFTMADIDRHGIARVFEQALSYAGEDTEGIHLSFDIDAVDPAIAQGTGTPSRGGLSYREAHLLMEMAHDARRFCALDMVEVNPLQDVQNHTAELAAELIQSALGKRIY